MGVIKNKTVFTYKWYFFKWVIGPIWDKTQLDILLQPFYGKVMAYQLTTGEPILFDEILDILKNGDNSENG